MNIEEKVERYRLSLKLKESEKNVEEYLEKIDISIETLRIFTDNLCFIYDNFQLFIELSQKMREENYKGDNK